MRIVPLVLGVYHDAVARLEGVGLPVFVGLVAPLLLGLLQAVGEVREDIRDLRCEGGSSSRLGSCQGRRGWVAAGADYC